MKRALSVTLESWPLQAPFRITGHVFTAIDVVVVEIGEDGASGRGEAAGVYYLGDTPKRIADQIERLRYAIRCGLSRERLATALPPGGARNALDCALWDLEAKLSGRPAWAAAGFAAAPAPLTTTYTLGTDTPERMAAGAGAFASARALKLKLVGDGLDGERVTAVRAARPDVWLGVDANQGLDRASYDGLLPALVDARVALLEQPFPRTSDRWLDGLECPLPIAADESVQSTPDLEALVGRVDVINIKLDKCGGLTEGLRLAAAAKSLGFGLMVGNMMGTSLAMAPAWLLGQLCDVVDLDGPIMLAADRPPATRYEDGLVSCAPDVWGHPSER